MNNQQIPDELLKRIYQILHENKHFPFLTESNFAGLLSLSTSAWFIIFRAPFYITYKKKIIMRIYLAPLQTIVHSTLHKSYLD